MHLSIGIAILLVILSLVIIPISYVSAEQGFSDLTFRLQTENDDNSSIFGSLSAARWSEAGVYLADGDIDGTNLFILDPDTDTVIAGFSQYDDGSIKSLAGILSLAIKGDEFTDTIVYVGVFTGASTGEIIPLDAAAIPSSGLPWPILSTLEVIDAYDVAPAAVFSSGCGDLDAGSLTNTDTGILIFPTYMDVDSQGRIVTMDKFNNISNVWIEI